MSVLILCYSKVASLTSFFEMYYHMQLKKIRARIKIGNYLNVFCLTVAKVAYFTFAGTK